MIQKYIGSMIDNPLLQVLGSLVHETQYTTTSWHGICDARFFCSR